MSEKTVVGWAIKRYNAEHHDWYWCDANGGGYITKSERAILKTKGEAFAVLFSKHNSNHFNPVKDSYKIVRIVKKVKPKKYYVVAGPFDTEIAARRERAFAIYGSNASYTIETRPC